MESLKVMEKINSIEQLDALGVKICEMLQVGIDKASIVVPETLQQIVAWQMWNNGTLSILSFVVIIISFILIKHTFKKFIEGIDKDGEFIKVVRGNVIAICAVISFLSFLLLSITIPALIKVLTAPNLVIIEQLGGLVK